MRTPLFSLFCCTTLVFAQLLLQGQAQSSSTQVAQAPTQTNNESSPLPEATPAEVASSSSINQVTQSLPVVSLENKTTDPGLDITSNAPAIAKIILEGFVTSADNESVQNATELITMTDPTIETTAANITWNSTTEAPQDVIGDGDLTLSFISSSSHISTAAAYFPPAKTTAIFAGVFICFAFVAYGGLVIWRRVLERRYGNRELLVNEEFYDVNGLKYFEL